MRLAPKVLRWAALVVATVSCGRSDAGTLPTRETFIEAYVDLRVAALRAEDGQLTDSARAEILSRHGVTADDLLGFAEARGTDLAYMRDVWNEIELGLDSVPPLPRSPLPSPEP